MKKVFMRRNFLGTIRSKERRGEKLETRARVRSDECLRT